MSVRSVLPSFCRRPGAFLALIVLLPATLWAYNARERRVTLYDGAGILTLAEDYLGAPYRAGGTTPAGFDCSGFTSYVYSKAGYRLPRSAADQYSKLNPVRAPAIGDLVFFRIDGNRISHVGVYAGGYRFIHAPSSGKEVSYADLRVAYWKSRYAGSRSIFRSAR